MSLSIDGVWKVGVWKQTVWANGVWREGSVSVKTGTGGIDAPGRRKGKQVPIFKPTGLHDVGKKKGRSKQPTPEVPQLSSEIVAAPVEASKETMPSQTPSVQVTMADINAGIDTRVKKDLLNDDEERIMLLFLASQL